MTIRTKTDGNEHPDSNEHLSSRPPSSRRYGHEQYAPKVTSRSRAETKPRQLNQQTSNHQAALEDQRARIAREIHDQLGQSLTALKLDLALLMKDERDRDEKLAALMTNIEATIREMKDLVSGLRPRILEDFGLTAAVEWELDKFIERSGIRCTYSVTVEKKRHLSRDQSLALFRILQEALTNVVCHARASTLTVTLKTHNESALMEILDDGVGIDPSKGHDRRSLGLLTMKERARDLGGETRVTRQSRGGTRVSVRIPVGHRDAWSLTERRQGGERRTMRARKNRKANHPVETELTINDVMSPPGNGR